MKNIKRFFAAALCAAIAVTAFCGCHKKDETAVTVGKYTYTSGYYACAFVYAYNEGRQEVEKNLTASGKSTTDINYEKQKIDGKTFNEWVKEKAVENIKINAGYKALCEEKGYDLSEDETVTAESYANTYWTTYGAEEMFSKNGVSKATFTQYTKDTYYADVYFEKTYGKEGTDPVSEEKLKAALNDHYVLVDKIEVDTAALSDEEVTSKKAELQGYIDLLKTGSTFEDVYHKHNGDTHTDSDSEDTDTSDSADAESDSSTPLDSHAELLGDDKASSTKADFFDEAKEMAAGDIKILETTGKMALVIRKDVLEDPYYLSVYDDTLRHLEVGDEPTEAAKKKGDDLGVKTVASAVKVFKTKKIVYPE